MDQHEHDTNDDAENRAPWRREALTAAGVGLGGAIGASLRWSVGDPLRSASPAVEAFPWPTFAVNVLGCLLIGIASIWLSDTHRLRPLLVTGVLGGFTTMSAFAVELNDLADASRDAVTVTYVAATLAAGACAVVLGDLLASRMSNGRGAAT